MTSLIDNFSIIFNSKEKVRELRNIILQLAVRGKLVPQDQNDEPASELLKRIKEEKEKLIKEGKIKKEKPLPEIKKEEIPYELPNGWEWVRLGLLASKLGAGSTPKGGREVYPDKGIRFIRSQNVWNDGLRINDIAYITDEINNKMSGSIVKPEDILLNITGASIGRSCIVSEDFDIGNVNQHVSIIRLIDRRLKEFIHICIISPYIQKLIMDVQVGISREGLSMSKLATFLIPFPPLEEQRRIAQKVDKLMELCDTFEASLNTKERYNLSASKSISNMIIKSRNKVELKDSLKVLLDNFKDVYSTEENINDLRNIILQLAVQGRLVPQNPKDEPADELLKKIREKRTGKGFLFKSIEENDKIFELPNGWTFVRLGEVIELISGQHIEKDNYNENGIGIGYLTGPTDFGELYTKITKYTEHPKVIANKGDILITVKGSGIGKLNILTEDASIGRQLMAIRPILINNSYILTILKNSKQFFQNQKVGIAIPGISRDDILNLVIGLPPIEEQDRIVSKANSLMALCDKLERSIEESKNSSEMLMKSVLRESFNM